MFRLNWLIIFIFILSYMMQKEKRLKDLLRSKNCIVKRLQKHKEDRLDRSLLSAQVELKLVSRALKMSRLTTDQLAWCRKKLSQINIVNRKIQVEPSFLLFPWDNSLSFSCRSIYVHTRKKKKEIKRKED